MRVLFLGRDDKPTLRILRGAGDDVVATNEPVDAAAVRAAGVEAIVSHDYGHLVPADVLRAVRFAVNLHVSLLPWNRGTHPNLWSFVDDTPKGVTIHHMDDGVDTGDVVAQRTVELGGDGATLATTHARLQLEITELFAEVWPELRSARAPRRPQTWAGTYHRDRDLESIRHLLTDGWETPVSAVAGAGGRLRAASASRPRVVIRCDGSPTIGSGHVTRCRALAAALRTRGADVAFALRIEGGSGASQAAADGFPVEPMPGSATVVALDEGDLHALLGAAGRAGATCIVVDHYGADAAYLAGVRDAGYPLAVIDDRADRDLSAAGWLLNQNIAAPSLDYDVAPGGVTLLGCEFALLRPQFADARAASSRRFGAEDANVLLTLGGGDTASELVAALAALSAVSAPLRIRAVAGRDARPEAVEAAAAASPHDVVVLRDVADMATQMAWADLSVNAGGSTCWELMCLGVPMIVTSLSPDQRLNPEPLAEAGAAVAVDRGDWRGAAGAVEELRADPARRESMSRAGQTLVDGLGALRAAASLEGWLERTKEVAGASR